MEDVEALAEEAVRSAVDLHDQRIGLFRVESGRVDQTAGDLPAVALDAEELDVADMSWDSEEFSGGGLVSGSRGAPLCLRHLPPRSGGRKERDDLPRGIRSR